MYLILLYSLRVHSKSVFNGLPLLLLLLLLLLEIVTVLAKEYSVRVYNTELEQDEG